MKKYFKKCIIKSRISLKFSFVQGLLTLLDGMIAVVTLGHYHGSFAYEHCKENIHKYNQF